MKDTKVAVLGGGAMGSGIAHAFAAAALEVALIDISADLVEKGVQRIQARCTSEVKKGRLHADERDRIMGRIKGSVKPQDASDADLVIEAVVEDRKIKGELFWSLDRICSPGAVFATNTSTLSATDLGALSGRPSRFVGLHFFNPVHAMKLVEVIPGIETAKEVLEGAIAVVKSLRKVPIVVQDCPGFLVNRILLTYVGEAFFCAQEGTSPEQIDAEARQAGFPMGPLELSDMVGMDISMHTLPILRDAYGERFPFPLLVRKLYDAGRLGVKAGKGIYCGGKPDAEFEGIVEGIRSSEDRKGRSFSIERLILRQVNEAVYCLQEGVAAPEEIDRAMVLGAGFPLGADGTGGPLHWADERGLDFVLSTLEELKQREGARFWPHHLLKTYVSAGRLGRKTGRGFFAY